MSVIQRESRRHFARRVSSSHYVSWLQKHSAYKRCCHPAKVTTFVIPINIYDTCGPLYLAMRFQRLFGSSFLVLPTAVFMLNLPLNISPSVAPSWPSLNSPASLLYASANGLLPIRCNGSEFGHNLNLDSCRNALSYLPRPSSAETLSFGPRLRGGSNVVVPNRYLSCMLPSLLLSW